MTTIPRWSQRSLAALPVFYQRLNDIDVYVEDSGSEKFYATLIGRIAPWLRVSRVFTKNGRIHVIAAAQAHDFNRRPALFIIDGDFEWVRNEPPPQVPGVFRFDAYCVENVLLTEHSLIPLVMEHLLEDEQGAKNGLQFPNWFHSVSVLVELFLTWAVLSKFTASATTSLGYSSVVTGGARPVISEPAVAALISAAKVALQTFDATQVALSESAVRARLATCEEPIDIVSGKDFLFPFLKFHLNSIGCKTHNLIAKSLQFKLAMHPSTHRFRRLIGALARARAKRNNHYEVYR